ncbi:MAG: flagellar hook-length control protein FliK [Magnetococcales bacterium]|nr:flagellar hook-length control protein FliK [Magnetococcales bacterium]
MASVTALAPSQQPSPQYSLLSVTSAASALDLVQQLKLAVGDLFVGRVLSIDSSSGQGSLRLADGAVITFAGGANLAAGALMVGDRVSLEVSQTVPQVTLRLVSSESSMATQLADSTIQTVARAPEALVRLVNLLQTQQGGLPAAQRSQLIRAVQQSLPTLEVEPLLQGDMTAVTQLLSTSQLITESSDSIQQLRLTLAQLQTDMEQLPDSVVAGSRNANTALTTVHTTLTQLGDLLSLQTLLPSLSLTDHDGSVLAGYRLFLLDDGGWGEAIWRYGSRYQSSKSGQSQDEATEMVTVMLSLAMTDLGRVQARLSAGNGRLLVAIAAEEEQGLAALRQQIGELRGRLLAAGLPLQAIDLQHLSSTALESERRRMLGVLEEGFAIKG